jgi:ribosomal protein S27E
MKLRNAYKKAKHGAELYDPRILHGHIVGMKKGGSSLNRPITCSNCGHSWTVSDSGPNPLSCHNCGGVAKMQRGGKVDRSDDKDMVNGVASILRRVKDKKNRLQLANQLSNQFNREKVKYSLNDFLNKSKVKK